MLLTNILVFEEVHTTLKWRHDCLILHSTSEQLGVSQMSTRENEVRIEQSDSRDEHRPLCFLDLVQTLQPADAVNGLRTPIVVSQTSALGILPPVELAENPSWVPGFTSCNPPNNDCAGQDSSTPV